MERKLMSPGVGTFEFQCSECGEIHRGSPSFSYKKPSYYFDVPEAEREARVDINDDLCRIRPLQEDSEGQTIYCIRTTLDVPIHGADEPFCWGVWVTQSEESFKRYVETWDQDQSGDGSFGWLAVTMPYYNRRNPGEPFDSLKCDVRWGRKGQRPKVELQSCDHPLYIDQRDGISWETAIEIARLWPHPAAS
jgi:hypothetical protein